MILELKTHEEWDSAYPCVQALRPYVTMDKWTRSRDAHLDSGTRLFGYQYRGAIAVLAAVHMRLHLAGELELQVNDLITLPEHRRKGFGSEMMKYLEGFAHKNRCFRLIVHSGVQNVDAHRFCVERSGFKEHGIVFIKELKKLG